MEKIIIFMLSIFIMFSVSSCTEKNGTDTETSDVPIQRESLSPHPDVATEEAASTAQQDIIIEASYIGNKNSKKFHTSSCYTLPAEKNRVYFDSRDEAVSRRFIPCDNCLP